MRMARTGEHSHTGHGYPRKLGEWQSRETRCGVKLTVPQTCYGTWDLKEVRLAGHKVCSLFEDEHSLFMGESAFAQEMFPQKVDIGAIATGMWIADVELGIGEQLCSWWWYLE